MFKMLVTDIDYTLLDPPHPIHPESIAALHSLHARGIPVVFASGRATASTRFILRGVFPDVAAGPRHTITYNGACIVDEHENRDVLCRPVPTEHVAELAAFARGNGLVLQGYRDGEILVEEHGDRVRGYAEVASMPVRVVPDLAAALNGGSPKLFAYATVETQDRVVAEISALSAGRWIITSSMPGYVEITAPGVHKGSALVELAARLGIDPAEVVAVGDNLNDVEMVQQAGMGVAVANAREELKAVADWVTTRRASDGAVAELVGRFF